MSNLLGDLTSWIDSKKRIAADRVSTLLSDPATLATRAVSDVEQQYQPLIDAALRGDTAGIINSGLLGPLQTVWHGSPHLFDKFDASKIGTGEGAQAYAHGLYFADTKDVASNYTGAGPGGRPGVKLSTGDEFPYLSDEMIALWPYRGQTVQQALEQAKKKSEEFPGGDYSSFISTLKRFPPNAKISSGHLYKVDLPDEMIPKMLDWDKTLMEQPEFVKNTLENLGIKNSPSWPKGGESVATGPLAGVFAKQAGFSADKQGISEWLSSIGIPGIKYLDAGSRGTGKGTYNYVVFPGNEDLLKILERQ